MKTEFESKQLPNGINKITFCDDDAAHPSMLLQFTDSDKTERAAKTIRGRIRCVIMGENGEKLNFRICEVDGAKSLIKLEGNLSQAIDLLTTGAILNKEITALLLSDDEIEIKQVIDNSKQFILAEGVSNIDIAKPAQETQHTDSPFTAHAKACVQSLEGLDPEAQRAHLEKFAQLLRDAKIETNITVSPPSLRLVTTK